MALRLKNRVKETTDTTGTGSLSLGGAPTGFQSFSNALSDTDTTYYQITDGTNWEIGLGTYDSANDELARTEVFESSNSNSKVDWGEGSKDVFIVMPAEKVHTSDSYGATSDLPLTQNQVGDQAFVTSNNNLYVWNGSGWYKIATVNLTPSITTQPESTYTFQTDGTAISVTLAATDPEGFPLTWSATESGMGTLATKSQSDNVFTYTPSTDSGDQGSSFTATFSVTDGVNTAVSNTATFTIGIDVTASGLADTVTVSTPAGSATVIIPLSDYWDDLSFSLAANPTDATQVFTMKDRSGNNNTINLNPTDSSTCPQQSSISPYMEGWAWHLYDDTSRINFDDSDLDYTGDITVEGWLLPPTDAYASNYGGIFDTSGHTSYGHSSNSFSTHFGMWMNSSYGIRVYSHGSAKLSASTLSMAPNKWNHLVIQFDRSANSWRLWINGSHSDNWTFALAAYPDTFANFGIAPYWTGSYELNNGYFYGWRISDTLRYSHTSSAITVPTADYTDDANTMYLMDTAGRTLQNKANDENPCGSLKINCERISPFASSRSVETDDDYGSIENKAALNNYVKQNFASGTTRTWTLEFWYQNLNAPTVTANHYMVDARSGGQYYMYGGASYGVPNSMASLSSTDVSNAGLQDGGWHHMVIVADSTKTTNKSAIWIDGTRVKKGGSGTPANINAHIIYNTRYSAQYANDSRYADMRVTKSALYDCETDSTITVPTAPVGAGTSVAYLPCDNAGIYDITGNHSIVAHGTPQSDTSITKYADASIYFDGNGDYIDIVTHSNKKAFTLEGWIYPTYILSTNTICNFGQGTGNVHFGINGSNQKFTIESGVSGTVDLTATVSANTWVHFALVRSSGGQLRLYVGGTLQHTNNTNFANLEMGKTLRLGAYNTTEYFKGHMEGIQYFMLEKYTANFTPPTSIYSRSTQ